MSMRVVGLRYYQAKEAFGSGALHAGASVLVRREPGNRHDPYAYEVLSGEHKIGHLPRFAATILCGVSAPATFHSVVSLARRDGAELAVRLDTPTRVETPAPQHRLGTATVTGSGIYTIVNVYDMRAYIGKSKSMEQRRLQHLTSLQRGLHPSRRLQADWRDSPQRFAFVAVKAVSVDLLDSQEILFLKAYGTNDVALGYNQGEGFSPISEPTPEAKPESVRRKRAQKNTRNAGGQQRGAGVGQGRTSGPAVGQTNRPFVQVRQGQVRAPAPRPPSRSGRSAAPQPAGCGCLVALVLVIAGLSMALASVETTSVMCCRTKPAVTASATPEAER